VRDMVRDSENAARARHTHRYKLRRRPQGQSKLLKRLVSESNYQ
jgi:hypothetical protein